MDEFILLVAMICCELLAVWFLPSLTVQKFRIPAKAIWRCVLVTLVLIIWSHDYGWGRYGLALLYGFIVICVGLLVDWSQQKYPAHQRTAYILIPLLLTLVWAEYSQSWWWFSQIKPALFSLPPLLLLLAYLVVLSPASALISYQLKRLAQPQSSPNDSLQKAGHAIGMLERLLILTFVLIDELSGIGFLLAAKSVFRFGDLSKSEDIKLTEYVLLGTLLSFSQTILFALLIRFLLQLSHSIS